MTVDLHSGIRSLGDALRKRQVSSVELTQEYLRALTTRGARHRVARELTEDLALEQAKASDERRAAGKLKGPLDGIPYGAKDLLATKGIPTRWGSPGHADQVFDYDATVIERLRDAGAVLIAKLAMIELAGGGNYNIAGASDVGATLCAWDPKRWAGGSSSGSGAATALGCVGFSIGSETSGSIICPSAFNGVTGLRPSYGRVSRYGAMPLCWTLDKIGPIARSAEDCELVIRAIAGPDPKDRSTLTKRLERAKSGPLRIGLIEETFTKNKAAASEASYNATLDILKAAGHQMVNVKLPAMPSPGLAVDLIVNAEGASAHENFIRSDRFQKLADVNQVAGFTAAMETKAVDYLWAMRAREEMRKAEAIWSECDVIFTPVFYHAAISAERPFNETWQNMGDFDGPENLLGWPAVAFPFGFEDGAPIGGQFIGPVGSELTCLRLAQEFQKRTDFHTRKPPGVP